MDFYSGVFVGAIIAAIALALVAYVEYRQYEKVSSDYISRRYAIEQINLAIQEAQDEEEQAQFERFKDFIMALPEVDICL